MRGVVHQGKVVLAHEVDWADGTEVNVQPLGEPSTFGIREEDWRIDPEGIQEWLAWYDLLEPLIITPDEEAEIAAWRQKVKEYTISHMNDGIEGLFE